MQKKEKFLNDDFYYNAETTDYWTSVNQQLITQKRWNTFFYNDNSQAETIYAGLWLFGTIRLGLTMLRKAILNYASTYITIIVCRCSQ